VLVGSSAVKGPATVACAAGLADRAPARARGHSVRILTCRIAAAQPRARDRQGGHRVPERSDALLRRPFVGFYAVGCRGTRSRRRRRRPPGGTVDVVIEDPGPGRRRLVGTACAGLGVPLVLDVHYLLGRTRDWLRMYGPIGLWGAIYERLLVSARSARRHWSATPGRCSAGWRRSGPTSRCSGSRTGRRVRSSPPGPQWGPVRIAAVGRLAPPKGHRVLIERWPDCSIGRTSS
jgi:hypothetical protein